MFELFVGHQSHIMYLLRLISVIHLKVHTKRGYEDIYDKLFQYG